MEGNKQAKKLEDKETQNIIPRGKVIQGGETSQKGLAGREDAKQKNQISSGERSQARLYEVRTMQHDIDQIKGKTVQPISISSSRLFGTKTEPAEQKDLGKQAHFARATRKKYFPREGSVSQIEQKTKFSWRTFLDRIRFLRSGGRFQIPHIKLGLALITLIIIFIGGAGYYLYANGAFSALSGINFFQGIFHHSPAQQQPPVASKATTTPPVSSSTPVVSTSSPALNIPISSSFFTPDDQIIIKIDSLDKLEPSLEERFGQKIEDNKFRRVVFILRGTLSSLNFAQILHVLRQITLGNKIQYPPEGSAYRELIANELIDGWGLSMPGSIYQNLAKDYNLFFYGQPGDASRVVLIFKVQNIDRARQALDTWEQTMIYDLKELFLGMKHGEPFTDVFVDNYYKKVHIRYLNLPRPDITLDYALLPQEKYLIFTTSRESMWATIDRIVGGEDSDINTINETDDKDSLTAPVSTSTTSTPGEERIP